MFHFTQQVYQHSDDIYVCLQKLHQYPGGGVLNFGLSKDVRHEELVERISDKCWLAELIFFDKLLTLRTNFGPNLGFLNWILAWEHENCPKFRYFSRNFKNFVIFGLVELKYAEKGVLWKGWGLRKRRCCPPDNHITIFKVSTPKISIHFACQGFVNNISDYKGTLPISMKVSLCTKKELPKDFITIFDESCIMSSLSNSCIQIWSEKGRLFYKQPSLINAGSSLFAVSLSSIHA